jgi:hypothetical protein
MYIENIQNPSEAKHSCIFNAFLLFIQAPAFFSHASKSIALSAKFNAIVALVAHAKVYKSLACACSNQFL